MATRPVFVPNSEEDSLVREVDTEFKWHPGFALTQKRKNIRGLHEAAAEKGIRPILEISTKSESNLGRKLSAFNLKVTVNNTHEMTVEAAYQGSKVFDQGGPYTDLYNKSPREVKKDPRLRESGDLIKFELKEDVWELEPETAFYDWIYVNALHQNQDLKHEILDFQGFTDIEFNPKKSVNCQARGAALFVSLRKRGILQDVLRDKEAFRKLRANGSHKPIDNKGCANEAEPEKVSEHKKKHGTQQKLPFPQKTDEEAP